jgi:hypothetical protein
MSTRKLILHLGAPKTGTTSLQRYLALNAGRLADRVEICTPTEGSPTREMGRSALLYSLDPSPKAEARLAAAIRAQREALSGPGVTLISHENLLGAVPGNGGTRALYPHWQAILALLDEGFAPLRPQYAVYTREMAGWKASVHAQITVSDGYAAPLAAYLADYADCGDWTGLETAMRAGLGDRLSFFRLEDETDAAHPGRQLLALAGLDAADCAALQPVSTRSNPRVAPAALEFIRRLNEMDLPQGARFKVVRLVTQNQALFANEGGSAPSKPV